MAVQVITGPRTTANIEQSGRVPDRSKPSLT